MKRPKEVNILGIIFKINYISCFKEVDIDRKAELRGQIEFQTRTIRIYDCKQGAAAFWGTILHEVLHGIVYGYNLSCLRGEKNHNELGVLARALADILCRNGWIKDIDPQSQAEKDIEYFSKKHNLPRM